MASAPFMPIEIAFKREVTTAAEIVDGVTLRRIRSGIAVAATGLTRKPIVNASGLWVWLAEKDRTASAITVSSQTGAYDDASGTPVALPGRARIELAPTPKYRFGAGATAIRGKLIETNAANASGVAGAAVRMQWSNDNGWNDTVFASLSDANGEFATALRLPADAEATIDASGTLSVRLVIDRAGVTRASTSIPLRQGAVGAAGQAVIWDQLLAYP